MLFDDKILLGIYIIYIYDLIILLFIIPIGDLRLLTSGTPTRVIMISNMATNNDLHDSNRYLDIIEELRLECSQFGIVRSVIVPRTNVTTTMSTMSNTNQMQIHYQSICKAFIEMNSIEQAVQVVLGLKGRSFDNRILGIIYIYIILCVTVYMYNYILI